MIIVLFIIISILIANFMPRKYLTKYFSVCVIALCSFYFVYKPDELGDLYRHNQILEIYKNLTLSDVFTRNYYIVETGPEASIASLFNSYLNSYPAYSLYMFLIAKVPIENFLPFISGLLTYMPGIYIISDIYNRNRNIQKWKLILAFAFVMFGMNFMEVSGIRSAISTSVFTYALYCDFSGKKSTVKCAILYVVCCLFHSYCIAMLLIRILGYFYIGGKDAYRRIVAILVVLVIPIVTEVLPGMINNNSFFGSVVSRAIVLFSLYSGGQSSFGYSVVSVALFVTYFLIYLMSKRKNTGGAGKCLRETKNEERKLALFNGYMELFLLFLLPHALSMTFTSRSRGIFFILGIYPLMGFLDNIGSDRFLQITGEMRNVIVYIAILISITIDFYLAWVISYSAFVI